jgi:hypothetical protein
MTETRAVIESVVVELVPYIKTLSKEASVVEEDKSHYVAVLNQVVARFSARHYKNTDSLITDLLEALKQHIYVLHHFCTEILDKTNAKEVKDKEDKNSLKATDSKKKLEKEITSYTTILGYIIDLLTRHSIPLSKLNAVLDEEINEDAWVVQQRRAESKQQAPILIKDHLKEQLKAKALLENDKETVEILLIVLRYRFEEISKIVCPIDPHAANKWQKTGAKLFIALGLLTSAVLAVHFFVPAVLSNLAYYAVAGVAGYAASRYTLFGEPALKNPLSLPRGSKILNLEESEKNLEAKAGALNIR